jgi:4-diphosphocytidyl-2-C-methyl-D-erythritol kinase
MPSSLTLLAPAKLNLFLHITGQRSDGYHELQTIFQLLNFGDTLTFQREIDSGVQLTCSDKTLETNDNLIIKAARSLEVASGKNLNVKIHLEKRLPMGGGIGGGSSDCATTLLGLNRLFELNIPIDQLLNIAKTLGADVPVFVNGRTAWAEGIGEKLIRMEMPKKWFVVVHPHIHVSTPTLFKHSDLTRNTPIIARNPNAATAGVNDFEPLVRTLYPDIDDVFKVCRQYGTAKLTGSGACLFLTSDSQREADKIAAEITNEHENVSAFVAQGVNTSGTLQELNKLA